MTYICAHKRATATLNCWRNRYIKIYGLVFTNLSQASIVSAQNYHNEKYPVPSFTRDGTGYLICFSSPDEQMLQNVGITGVWPCPTK